MSARNIDPRAERETGSASLLIDLTDSRVTVYHGTEQTEVLGTGAVYRGDWDRLIDFLRKDLGIVWEVPL